MALMAGGDLQGSRRGEHRSGLWGMAPAVRR
jgi:hypothetical protein